MNTVDAASPTTTFAGKFNRWSQRPLRTPVQPATINRHSNFTVSLPIAHLHQNRQAYRMTWKATALAFLLAVIALLTSFLLTKMILTWWYMRPGAYGDGQAGLSIVYGSIGFAMLCGLVTFGIVLKKCRRGP